MGVAYSETIRHSIFKSAEMLNASFIVYLCTIDNICIAIANSIYI